jgi:hypothetical protein
VIFHSTCYEDSALDHLHSDSEPAVEQQQQPPQICPKSEDERTEEKDQRASDSSIVQKLTRKRLKRLSQSDDTELASDIPMDHGTQTSKQDTLRDDIEALLSDHDEEAHDPNKDGV